MNAAALQSFNAARLKVNYGTDGIAPGLFSKPVIYVDLKGKQFPQLGCHSAVTNAKELRDGGFAMIHDFIGRLRKDWQACKPQEEATFIVNGVTYAIKEVVDHPFSGEWKLGLRSNV